MYTHTLYILTNAQHVGNDKSGGVIIIPGLYDRPFFSIAIFALTPPGLCMSAAGCPSFSSDPIAPPGVLGQVKI